MPGSHKLQADEADACPALADAPALLLVKVGRQWLDAGRPRQGEGASGPGPAIAIHRCLCPSDAGRGRLPHLLPGAGRRRLVPTHRVLHVPSVGGGLVEVHAPVVCREGRQRLVQDPLHRLLRDGIWTGAGVINDKGGADGNPAHTEGSPERPRVYAGPCSAMCSVKLLIPPVDAVPVGALGAGPGGGRPPRLAHQVRHADHVGLPWQLSSVGRVVADDRAAVRHCKRMWAAGRRHSTGRSAQLMPHQMCTWA